MRIRKNSLLFLFLLVTISLLANIAHATTIFSDGFESGDFSAWTSTYSSGSGTITISTETTHHGIYSAEHTVSTDGGARSIINISDASELYLRGYVQFASIPSVASIFGVGPRFARNGTALAYVLYNAIQGKWGVRNGVAGVTYLQSGSANLQTGKWYCVELYTKISPTAGAVKLWIDGDLLVDVSGINTGSALINQATANLYTNANEPQARVVYQDCYVVADAYIGPEATKSWKNIALYSETLTARAWQLVNTWNIQLIPMFWRQINQWNFQLLPHTWQHISQWALTAQAIGWHFLVYWSILAQVYVPWYYNPLYILAIGAAIFTGIILFIKFQGG